MEKERKKVLVATSTWPLGKDDRRTPFVRDLAMDLSASGWDVAVVAPHHAGARLEEMDGPVLVKRFRYMMPERLQVLAYGAGAIDNMRKPAAKLLAPAFVLQEARAIRAMIRGWRPDIVHAHWLLPQGWCAAIAARGRVPVVATVHGGDVFGLRSRAVAPFKRHAARMADAVTVNGTATQKAAYELGADPGSVSTIRFGPSRNAVVDKEGVAAWRRRFPAGAFVALFAGRLVPEKGPDDFIKAVAACGDARVHGVICGDGPMMADLRSLAAALGISSRITFEGWLDSSAIAIRMAGSDLYLGPSKRSPEGWVEAQGVSFAEAMMAGLPVLATRSGGIPDIIRPGETGWLFKEGDVGTASGILGAIAGGRMDGVDATRAKAAQFARLHLSREAAAESFERLFRRTIAQHAKEGRAQR